MSGILDVSPATEVTKSSTEPAVQAQKVRGLEGVIALESEICFIDGQKGELVYRGYDIEDLGANVGFEEVLYLLWNGKLPDRNELEALNRQLRSEREVPQPVLNSLKHVPANADATAVLRTAVSSLAFHDPEAEDMSPEANYRKAIRITARIPTLIAAFDRARKGLEIVRPTKTNSTAYDFLYMLNGKEPGEAAVRTFDAALVLHAEHGLNASTFAARVIASTLSDIYSAVTGALGALKGPLHGGANVNVMKMLLEIDRTGADPAEYVRERLARKERIMGFGHRVYKVLDPRAAILREMLLDLSEETGNRKWYEISTAIKNTVEQEKGLYPNVDYFSASVYYMLGIDIDLYTPIFGMSRIAGWTAHVLEQWKDNRLIRPRAEYVGPRTLKVVPIEAR